MSKPYRGVLYVALGNHFLREAYRSARSLHRHHPEIPVQLFTDIEDLPEAYRSQFKFVVTLPSETYLAEGQPVLARVLRARVNCLRESCFQQTLHLDSDTLILRPIDALWSHLDNVDFSIANEPLNDHPNNINLLLDYKNLRYYNAGVFAFRDSVPWKQFLQEWCKRLDSIPDADLVHMTGGDQRPLNQMIWDDGFPQAIGMRIAELDNLKFNARGIMFKRLRAEGKWNDVCIAHSHVLHVSAAQILRWKAIGFLRRLRLLGR
ncbi:MAG: hypothetical protein WCI20_04510 [bacterium]